MADLLAEKKASLGGGTVKPSTAQRRYLERGLMEPGGKLPLFDRYGQRIKDQTVQACLSHGWCEPWCRNPIKPDWLVCKLTENGRKALGKKATAKAPVGGQSAEAKMMGIT